MKIFLSGKIAKGKDLENYVDYRVAYKKISYFESLCPERPWDTGADV